MNEELRKATNKNKSISIKNGVLNDFLSGMVDKRLIWMFCSFLEDRILRLKTPTLVRNKFESIGMDAWPDYDS